MCSIGEKCPAEKRNYLASIREEYAAWEETSANVGSLSFSSTVAQCSNCARDERMGLAGDVF